VSVRTPTVAGTEAAPVYIPGLSIVNGDVRMARRLYLYQTPEGLVSGSVFTVRFTVDAPPSDVWPIFKDFNLWQSSHHAYSGVVGEMEGKTFRISSQPHPEQWLWPYEVIRVVPEHLLVFRQPVPDQPVPKVRLHAKDDWSAGDLVGGGVSPGFHVFTLSERDGKSDVTVVMQHARRDASWSDEEQALAPWRQLAPGSQEKWGDFFIPTLKRLVAERRQ
jgi:uncharacterized protein YndB with AHSA1/START domain